MNDDDSLPAVPLFRLLTPDRVAALLRPRNSLSQQAIYHDAKSIAKFGEKHHWITLPPQQKTQSVNNHQPPSPPKRRMRHNPEHEHL